MRWKECLTDHRESEPQIKEYPTEVVRRANEENKEEFTPETLLVSGLSARSAAPSSRRQPERSRTQLVLIPMNSYTFIKGASRKMDRREFYMV